MKGFPTFVNYEGYTRDIALQSVGEGWKGLINEVFDALETKYKNIKIIQVKEKWGGLRIYTDHLNDSFDALIRDVEKRSFTICEVCGEVGALRAGSWYRTLCDIHGAGKEVVKNPLGV